MPTRLKETIEKYINYKGVMFVSGHQACQLTGYSTDVLRKRVKDKGLGAAIHKKHRYYHFGQIQDLMMEDRQPRQRGKDRQPRPAKLPQAPTTPKGYCSKCKQAEAEVDFEDFDGRVKKLCWECWEGY